MVKIFTSKLDKHFHDDDKRKESLKKKIKERFNQKLLIKNALSDSNANRTSTKIIFDFEETENNETKSEDKLSFVNRSGSSERKVEKKNLFNESDNEESEKYEIKVRNCFEGKKGHKLLHLQSNYNNDERFRLDERFQDDVNEGEETGSGNVTEYPDKANCNSAEKIKQIELLEDVLGHSIRNERNETKSKKSFFEMVRFDASNESHKRQKTDDKNVNGEMPIKKKSGRDKRDKIKKKSENNVTETSKPITSDKKFYEISTDLKAALRNRKKESTSFSLLATFSENDSNAEAGVDGAIGEENGDEIVDEMEKWSPKYGIQGTDGTHDNGDEGKIETKVHGIANEPFFFGSDDPRLEEGMNFICMKDSDELKQVMENYDKTRRDLREVLRLRLQKFRQRKNPFKRKIGGSEMKVSNFNKNKRFKRSPVRKK